MRILIIGGTRFIGPPLVQELVGNGHDVTLFHRGMTHDDRVGDVRRITGDRKHLADFADEFRGLRPDVVVDTFPLTPDNGRDLMEVMKGVTPRVVMLSSGDVYMAYGRLHRTELGPVIPTPLTEDSPLRDTYEPHGYNYDNIAIERYVLGHEDVAGTSLRLPAIYGPKDEQRRFQFYVKRIDDGRPVILMSEDRYNWRFSHEYVDNVAHAVALAVENERAMGQIYNVAEFITPREGERVRLIGDAMGWDGEIIAIPNDQCPDHLKVTNDLSQDLEIDASKIRAELGYKPVVPESEALERTVEWERTPSDIDLKAFDYDAEDRILDSLK